MSSAASQTTSRVATPLSSIQFGQTTFHIKTEPSGEVVASPVTRVIPASSLPASQAGSRGPSTSLLSMSSTQAQQVGLKTVVSVRPMVKEEPMTTTDISPPVSPPNLLARTPGPATPMSPDFNPLSPPILTPKVSLAKPGQLSSAPGQTVVSMSTDQSRPASVVPAEMSLPMEVDSVSVDLNQPVDDKAFKAAASLGHGFDSAGFKALVQPGGASTSLGQLGTNAVKTVSLESSSPGTTSSGGIKTINLGPSFDGAATLKTINLGSATDSSPFKNLSLTPSADGSSFKTISVNSVGDAGGLVKTVKVPLTQLSPNHLSPVQFTAPLAHTVSIS